MHLKTDTSSNAHYSRVPTISHSRNAFSIAETHKTTIKYDYLYPIYHKYIYPGDTLSVTEAIMARLTTQVAPLYDDLYFDLHAWFVPMRLIQTNWARFQFNAQPTGPTQDNSALTTPKITLSGLGAGGFVAKTLYDYFGLPTEVNLSANVEHINNYLARGYNLIWNENYRDQNLQTAVTVDVDDGPDDPTAYVLLKRGKRHDKFTSCLTAAQKGTAVTLPLGSTAPVWGSVAAAVTTANPPAAPVLAYRSSAYGMMSGENSANNDMGIGDAAGTGAGTFPSSSFASLAFANETLSKAFKATAIAPWYADLASATAATVNEWRVSIAVQHLLEADARGGTRDVESIQHRWGVTVPDFRLQRPEFLGSQTFTFDGHVVPQTSATSGSNYQGDLTQFSQAMSRFSVTHSFVEHGVFMMLLSARSNITYQQGLQRELSYQTRYDFFQPEFANLGEVAVLGKEIYTSAVDNDNNSTFGYQEYAYELRYSENRVSGEMRSNFATSRDYLHLADEYSSLPTLSAAWIQSNTDIDRNITVATATADPIELNMLCTGKIARTLPMYSVPGLLRL